MTVLRLDWFGPLLLFGLCAPALLTAVGCAKPMSGDRLLPQRFGGWGAESDVERYDTETIFSYIDGHAEVYLAYGMESCRSRRYAGPEGEPDIVADVFRLPSPDDAFGVFTVDLDGDDAAVGHDGLYRHGWLSFWKGPYFVSVYAEEETDEARAAVFELGHTISARIDADSPRPALVDGLPRVGLDRRSVRFLRSEQVLRMHLYLGEDEVAGIDADTSAALGKYLRDGSTAHLLVVDYPTEERARIAHDNFSARFQSGGSDDDVVQDAAGRWYGSHRVERRVAYVIGAGGDEMVRSLLEEAFPGDRHG
jgi:hypothetical protein